MFDGNREPGEGTSLRVVALAERLDFAAKRRQGAFQLADRVGKQFHAGLFDQVRHGCRRFAGGGDAGVGSVESVSVLGDWFELFELMASGQDELVGASEIAPVLEDVGDTRSGVDGIEHVSADKVGEVADGLHGHRLHQQVERGWSYGQPAAQAALVGLEVVVEDLGAGRAQRGANRAGVGMSGQVLGDVEGDRRGEVHAVQCAGGFKVERGTGRQDAVIG
jgi:hypothetical protein